MKTLTSFRKPIMAGALVLGAGLVQVAAQPLYPVTVSNYAVGTSQDGLSIGVPAGRDNPSNALFPQNSDVDMGEVVGNSSTVNFVSLGFGGTIDLAFSQPFGSGEGTDLEIFETSYNTPNCSSWQEFANVYISQDGCNWVQVAAAQCQNFGVELPDNMPWALYVRIEDASPNAAFGSIADGYDVDGVRANYLSNVALKPAEALRYADSYVNFIQGSIKANAATLPAVNRRDPNKAVGPATGSDVAGSPVFVSLGFDKMSTAETEGQITLTFDYTVFDRPGADITVFETTFGDNGVKTCDIYPEVAEFWGSNDGMNWTLLAAASSEPSDAYLGGSGRLCRDGQLEIAGMPVSGGASSLRYLKIIDKSIKTSSRFPGSADGYDVDGVFAFPCDMANDGKYGLYDQNDFPDEDASMFFAGIAPNPTDNIVNIKLETAGSDQNYSIRVIDIMGRIVLAEGLNASANSFVNHVMDLGSLPAGIYMISIESNNYKVIEKLIKN
jgi:hypothetical protein